MIFFSSFRQILGQYLKLARTVSPTYLALHLPQSASHKTLHNIQYCCFSGLSLPFNILKLKPLHFRTGNGISLFHQTSQNRHSHLKMGAQPAPENAVASFVVYWTMEQVQRNSNTTCNAPSLEPFRVILLHNLYKWESVVT
jgi:hypothetical protein